MMYRRHGTPVLGRGTGISVPERRESEARLGPAAGLGSLSFSGRFGGTGFLWGRTMRSSGRVGVYFQAALVIGAACCLRPASAQLVDHITLERRQLREAETRKSDSTRLVTGPVEHLESVIAGDGTGAAIIRLTPKTTHPSGSYNTAGCYSNANITGQMLRLPAGGPCTTFWNVEVLNWQDNPTLRGWQGRINAMAFANGVGANVSVAALPCTSSSQCTTLHGEAGAPCVLGACRGIWINRTRPDGFQIPRDPFSCDPPTWDLSNESSKGPLFFGSHAPDQPDLGIHCSLLDSGQVVYGGTLALHVPAGARGTYTLSWVDGETFMINNAVEPFPIAPHVPGVIVVPSGSCCFGLGGATPGCADDVFEAECAAMGGVTHFVEGGICLNPPGSAGCGLCQLAGQCNDQNVCTTEVCVNNRCGYRPASGTCDDGDACTTGGVCSGGACEETAIPCCGEPNGTGCDDGLFCTDVDQCVDELCTGGGSPCLAEEWCHEDDGECELLGDYNGDGDIDGDDFSSLTICLQGPEVTLVGDCGDRLDFDGDGDVDMLDVAEFMIRFSS